MEELLTLAGKEIVEESVNAVRTIADSAIKTKAYYNALAANAVETYLRAQGLINGEIFNLHASAKMLADFEIADIQLPNLHIDVRTVFDEETIFIPKKHFNNNILPDVYLILKVDEDLTNGTLLGFVKPSRINKQNQNEDYYFVNKSFLTPVSELRNLILSTSQKTQYMVTDVTEGSIEKLIMLYMDHDLDSSKLEKLIDYLKNSAVAREKLVEFENFERLSYLALKEFKDLDIEKNDFTQYIKTLVTTDEFAEFEEHKDDLSVLFNEDSAPASGGLFIDEEVEQPAPEEEVVAEVEQEVYEESEVLGTDEEEEIEEAVEEVAEEIVEEASVEEETFPEIEADVEETVQGEDFEEVEEIVAETAVEDLAFDALEETVEEEASEVEEPVDSVGELEEFAMDEAPETNVEEVVAEEPIASVDEFEAFEAVEEFEQEEAPAAVEEEPVMTDDEPVVEEQELMLDSDELTIEAGDVLSIELPEESVEIETFEETAEVPELPEEALSGEDLELHVDGLDDITEALAVDEGVQLDEVVAETEELPVMEEETVDVEAFAAETPVEEEAQMEEFSVDEEPVALEDVETEEAVEEVVEDSVPDFDLEGMEFDTEAEATESVETVTDEDVDNAIALSELEEETVHETVDEISSDEASENGEFSLDELLSIENDLTSASDDAPKQSVGFKFDDDEEAPVAPAAVVAPSEEDLALLAADLDDEEEVSEEEDDALVGLEGENAEGDAEASEELSEEDEGTDFAFAVDQKPAGAKKLLAPIAALIAVIGLAGVGAWYFLFNNGKAANNNVGLIENNPSSVEDISLDINNEGSNGDPVVADVQIPADAQPVKPEEKKPEEAKAAPAAPEKKAEATPQIPADVKPLPEPLTLQKIKKDFSQPNTYLSVSKIVWDVPEYLTYNDDFSGYLQTLGSTLKLNLSGDLLLLSENTLFDKIRVRVELKDSGKKFSAEITDGSGTKSVDDLVLQSVKNTLNLLKPPVNSLDTADENLYITIYL